MSRIAGLPESRAGWLARLVYGYAKRRFGKPLTPMTVMAHHPWIFRGSSFFEFALERARQVEPKLKALASIKAATLIGCPF